MNFKIDTNRTGLEILVTIKGVMYGFTVRKSFYVLP